MFGASWFWPFQVGWSCSYKRGFVKSLIYMKRVYPLLWFQAIFFLLHMLLKLWECEFSCINYYLYFNDILFVLWFSFGNGYMLLVLHPILVLLRQSSSLAYIQTCNMLAFKFITVQLWRAYDHQLNGLFLICYLL